jgi:hypothetical protein
VEKYEVDVRRRKAGTRELREEMGARITAKKQ